MTNEKQDEAEAERKRRVTARHIDLEHELALEMEAHRVTAELLTENMRRADEAERKYRGTGGTLFSMRESLRAFLINAGCHVSLSDEAALLGALSDVGGRIEGLVKEEGRLRQELQGEQARRRMTLARNEVLRAMVAAAAEERR